jgi:hypothetical protein
MPDPAPAPPAPPPPLRLVRPTKVLRGEVKLDPDRTLEWFATQIAKMVVKRLMESPNE